MHIFYIIGTGVSCRTISSPGEWKIDVEFSKRWEMNAAQSLDSIVRYSNMRCCVVSRYANNTAIVIIRLRQIANLKMSHLHFVRRGINEERVEGTACRGQGDSRFEIGECFYCDPARF